MGIGWETVGRIIERVVARRGPADLLEGLTHIGIDELSYRKRHKYVTIVTDLKKSRVVWVAPGKNADTVRSFFDTLGAERSKRLELVAIDMSGAYIEAVREKAPRGAACLRPVPRPALGARRARQGAQGASARAS
jgi:transposase